MAHRALIVDDEADIRELLSLTLDRIGLDTYTAGNLQEARHLIDTYQFDVCLTDMRLPDGNGIDFLKHLQNEQPTLPVAVITAHGNVDAAVDAMKNGAFDFVSKPVDIKHLRQLVLQAININPANDGMTVQADADNSSPHAANDSLTSLSGRKLAEQSVLPAIGSDRLIGQSEPLQSLRAMIRKVARTNAPVWITGESGTGKELIARLIHENSARAAARFVAINCGAIPSELMESEMFGHCKGSFTGAHADHDGLFKQAEGGTLFLDEVAELPVSMQVKLLRVIQERSVRPVGGKKEISTDVRILSASHKDLGMAVNSGSFRHDLYYRLNVICVKAPSLRERASDIPAIARHILRRIAQQEERSDPIILSSEAQDCLVNYAYPGNVRELENILERAVAMSEGEQIESADLNLQEAGYPPAQQIESHMVASIRNQKDERLLIEQTLQQTRWNRREAAEILGLSYRQLRYRIQQYGIGENNQTGT